MQTISWKEYFIVVGLGVLFYYGWWLVRYYPGLPVGRPGAAGRGDRHAGETEKIKEMEETKEVMGTPETEAKEMRAPEENGGKQLELPLPAVIERPLFLPEVAARLIEEVMRLTDRAIREQIVEGELTYMLQRLLGSEPYRRLRGTDYEEKMNALLAQELERYGSVRPDAEVVKGLWRG